jgi:hypothetical protein
VVEGLVRNVEGCRKDLVIQLLVNSDQPGLSARVLGGDGVAAIWLAPVTLIMVTQEESTRLGPDELRAELRTFVLLLP